MNSGQEFQGTTATVMGLGLFGGGASVARFLAERGAEVTITDLRDEELLKPALAELSDLPLRTVLGKHELADFEDTDLVVANPGVPPASRFLQAARRAEVPISSAVALFLERTRARLCAVTGTHGKSSTCNLLTSLLTATGRSAHLGGNIRGSLLDRVDELTEDEIVVLELSSYQLEALRENETVLRCFETVAVLNVLEDHLERHGTLEAYASAKRQLLAHVRPKGTVLLPADDPQLASWQAPDATRVLFSTSETRSPLHIEDGEFRSGDESLARIEDLRLPGEFQRVNALVALAIAHSLGVSTTELAPALRTCRGLPHRLEDLGLIAGRRVWDNAVSTTPESTVSALESLDSGFTLLVGGQLKDSSLEPLARLAAKRAKRTICFGASAATFAEALRTVGARYRTTSTMNEAVELAFELTQSGETLLFSPAAASFDAYPNFQARAWEFRASLRSRADASQSPGEQGECFA